MKNCPDCGEPWPEHGCPAATQERLRRELWEQAALRVERERWKAEALAARQPEILGYSWDLQRRVFNADGTVKRGYHVCDALRVYAAARAANGEE